MGVLVGSNDGGGIDDEGQMRPRDDEQGKDTSGAGMGDGKVLLSSKSCRLWAQLKESNGWLGNGMRGGL